MQRGFVWDTKLHGHGSAVAVLDFVQDALLTQRVELWVLPDGRQKGRSQIVV